MIDLRSDTVTTPTADMRKAMMAAQVGDDVLGDDPTAMELQIKIADLLDKEAALFMPSGTMTNQVAIRSHCRPGDELLCEGDCHIYNYEQGAFAQLSGVVAHPIMGTHGVLTLDDLRSRVRPRDDHMVYTRLLCIENTHNRGGGTIQPPELTRELCDWAHGHGLATHLDGARLFNAAVALDLPPSELTAGFDTVSICFSKGLGAPVGSALAGPVKLIREARRHRKLFGGGMRQSGIIAAAALYALEHHIERLSDDHANARMLANVLRETRGLTLVNDPVVTNIVYFDVAQELGTAADFVQDLASQGVGALCESTQRIRLLTHLDVSAEQVERAGLVIQQIVEQRCVTRGATDG